MKLSSRMLSAVVVIGVFTHSVTVLAGELDPPAGPIAPTPGPEPRTPISDVNTPGDADSVFKISVPGSYYLTGSVAGVAGKHGIEIESSGVSVDLMGFDVVGVPGSLSGVSATAASLTSIEVRNGSIRLWGQSGLDLATIDARHVRVESIRSVANGLDGITLGLGSAVLSCVADDNTGTGIRVGQGSTVSDCIADDNGSKGFILGGGCSISGSSASTNGTDGFDIGLGASISGCAAFNNTAVGILAGVGSTVSQCSAYFNGSDGIACSVSVQVVQCNASNNDGDGIQASGDCAVIGNMCDSNGFGGADGAGIHVISSDTRVEGNNCTDNDRGIDMDVAGSIVIRNTCSGNTTNWDIVIGNAVAPIVSATTNAAAIAGNAYAGSLGSTDPNANFTY